MCRRLSRRSPWCPRPAPRDREVARAPRRRAGTAFTRDGRRATPHRTCSGRVVAGRTDVHGFGGAFRDGTHRERSGGSAPPCGGSAFHVKHRPPVPCSCSANDPASRLSRSADPRDNRPDPPPSPRSAGHVRRGCMLPNAPRPARWNRLAARYPRHGGKPVHGRAVVGSPRPPAERHPVASPPRPGGWVDRPGFGVTAVHCVLLPPTAVRCPHTTLARSPGSPGVRARSPPPQHLPGRSGRHEDQPPALRGSAVPTGVRARSRRDPRIAGTTRPVLALRATRGGADPVTRPLRGGDAPRLSPSGSASTSRWPEPRSVWMPGRG
jgi:hypothetical protein